MSISNEDDIRAITESVTKKQRMDVTYLTRTQLTSMNRTLKSIGGWTDIKQIREVIDNAQEYAMNVIMIQQGFKADAIKLVRDRDSLFFRRWDKEFIMVKEWGSMDDQDRWQQMMDQYMTIFEKTLFNKLKEEFLDK